MYISYDVFDNLEAEVNIELPDIDTEEVEDKSKEHENMVKIKLDLVKIEHNLEEEIINAEYQQKIKLEINTINTWYTAVPIWSRIFSISSETKCYSLFYFFIFNNL